MNRPAASFEKGGKGPASMPVRWVWKGSDQGVSREIPRRGSSDASPAEQEVWRRTRLRGARLSDQALRIQQMELLLAARARPLVHTARQAEVSRRGVI